MLRKLSFINKISSNTMREAARLSAARSREVLRPAAKNTDQSSMRAATRKARNETPVKAEKTKVKDEPASPETHAPNQKRKRSKVNGDAPPSTPKRIKAEDVNGESFSEVVGKFRSPNSAAIVSPQDSSTVLMARKLKAYTATAGQSPFPDFKHPTAAEAKLAHKILGKLHGVRKRPEKVVASKSRAGCGDSPSVLDALVRTILSQNTSDTNSTRAKLSMDSAYGASDRWDAVVEGGQKKLEDAIRCGGLSQTKSRVIISILNAVNEKYGVYSLDHLFKASNEDAMQEMLSFQGVGPKTASCVLLFCLQRESFAVDTHVHRITGLLGWRPAKASRDETHAHLDVRIPDEDKYGLHVLLVNHGKRCEECRAGGKNLGKCELRKAFKKGKLAGEAGEDVKEEEEKKDVKTED